MYVYKIIYAFIFLSLFLSFISCKKDEEIKVTDTKVCVLANVTVNGEKYFDIDYNYYVVCNSLPQMKGMNEYVNGDTIALSFKWQSCGYLAPNERLLYIMVFRNSQAFVLLYEPQLSQKFYHTDSLNPNKPGVVDSLIVHRELSPGQIRFDHYNHDSTSHRYVIRNYDDKKNVIEEINYDSLNIMTSKIVYTYDDKPAPVTPQYFLNNGSFSPHNILSKVMTGGSNESNLANSYTAQLVYDHLGNVAKKTLTYANGKTEVYIYNYNCR